MLLVPTRFSLKVACLIDVTARLVLHFNIRKYATILLFLFWGLPSAFLWADPAYRDNVSVLKGEVNSVAENLYFIKAPLDFEAIILGSELPWQRSISPQFNQGFTTDSLWLAMPLSNKTKNEFWYLTLDNTRLDFVDFYLVYKGTIQTKFSGDRRKLSEGSAFPTFRFKLQADEKATIYIRIATDTAVTFSPIIRTSEGYGAYWAKRTMIHWLYFCLVILCIFIQRIFNPLPLGYTDIFYSCTLVFGVSYLFCFYGEASSLLWPNQTILKNTMVFVFGLLFQISFISLLRHYLNIFSLSVRLHQACFVFTGAVLVLIGIVIVNDSNIFRTISLAVSGIITSLLTLAGILIALRKKYISVVGLSLCLLFSSVGILIWGFKFLGFFPHNGFTANILLFTFPLDAVALCTAFVFRHRSVRKECHILQEKIKALMDECGTKEANIKVSAQEPNCVAPTEKAPCQLKLPTTQEQLSAVLSQSRIKNIDRTYVLEALSQLFHQERPYRKEGLSLADIASSINVRPDQLSAIINSEFGTSFSAYINEYRVKEVCALLIAEPDASLLEISQRCGFASKTNFNRVFKQHTKMSPTAYRLLKQQVNG